MTIPEVKKLANEMVDYFVALTGYESREDIVISVINDELYDNVAAATTETDHTYKTHIIRIYYSEDLTRPFFERVMCHELVHIFCCEFDTFYKNFFQEEDEINITAGIWLQTEERIAVRISKILLALWKFHKNGAKNKRG